jgi:hypothetical protein
MESMTEHLDAGLEFARKCLGWDKAIWDGKVVSRNEGERTDHFTIDNFESSWPFVSDFLGVRYWLQVNRDRNTNARWRVAIGIQDVSAPGASSGSVEIIGDNQARALMAACVLAAEKLRVGGV